MPVFRLFERPEGARGPISSQPVVNVTFPDVPFSNGSISEEDAAKVWNFAMKYAAERKFAKANAGYAYFAKFLENVKASIPEASRAVMPDSMLVQFATAMIEKNKPGKFVATSPVESLELTVEEIVGYVSKNIALEEEDETEEETTAAPEETPVA